jgi:tetratricopeptide (TPR) repeat protein
MPTIKKRGYSPKKQPEQEFLTMAHRVSEFLMTYKKYIFAVSVAAVAVLVLAAGYAVWRSHQEQKAAPLVAEAYEYYSPSGQAPADFPKALALFLDIQKKYSSTMSGAIAQYYVGNCLANLGRHDESLKAYEDFVKTYSSEKFLLGLVYQRMGYTYTGLAKQADAIKAFEQAETLNGPGASTIELARLYEAAGNIPEAQKKYKLVIDKLGGTTWSMEAMAKAPKPAALPVPGSTKEAK